MSGLDEGVGAVRPQLLDTPGAGRRYRVAAVVCACLLSAAVVLVASGGDEAGRTELVGKLAKGQALWESDESPNHDPYFNVFDGGYSSTIKSGHAKWSQSQVRERVWQSLKDVKAMEQHVREQNSLNLKLKGEVDKLTGEAVAEKAEIRKLIDSGIGDVTSKILVLKHVAMGNVTAVRELLERIEREQEAKQDEQDEALDLLEKRQAQLVQLTKTKFDSESTTIEKAQDALKVAEAKVSKERSDVKAMIMKKIEGDIGGLGGEMHKQLATEKKAIQAKVDGRAKELDDRITDYSSSTGVRVARLVNKVRNLESEQKEQIAAQEVKVAAVKEDQVSLKQQTMADLATLRAKVEQTRAKLSEAEDTLQAEQAVHSTVVAAK